MKKISSASSGFDLVTKRTRKRVFLDEMSLVVSWRELVGLIQPFEPVGTKAFARCTGMSASAPRASACKRPEKALQYSSNTLELDGDAFRVSSDELLLLNSRCRGGSAGLPK